MSHKTIWAVLMCVSIFVVAVAEPALAGPGGKIAQTVFDSLWGRILLGVLVVVFLPLILYIIIREKIAERRSRRDLRFMARHSPSFEWPNIRERALECFHRVHSAWSKEDMTEAAEFMSHWYWQNQQLAFINEWERQGLINHCEIRKVSSIRPLLFVHRNDDSEHEGSLLVLAISATMKDYLAERYTDNVVQGSREFNEVETVWSFTLIDGKWRVTNIEEDSLTLEYARLVKGLPPIEKTLWAKGSA